MRYTIIGCGNSGLIHAAKLIEKGNEVALLKTSSTNGRFFDKIIEDGGFYVVDDTMEGDGQRFFVKPSLITRNVHKAVEFADVIMIMTTTTQHEFISELIAPYVKDGQLIVLVPGYMGSLLFRNHIKKDVVYSEWETTAYNGRIVDVDHVHITFYNPRNAISVLPVSEADKVLGILSQGFDNTRYLRKHILESAFHNPNMIVHPIGILFSTSRIEYSNGEFWMYREAFTPSVVNVIKAFDKSKNKVLRAFGCEELDYFEAAKWRNSEDLDIDAMAVFRSFADSSNKGPTTVNHRYLMEDVPQGLCLFVSVAKVVGVDPSLQNAEIELASALLNKDLRASSRTIQHLLGTETATKEMIIEAIS